MSIVSGTLISRGSVRLATTVGRTLYWDGAIAPYGEYYAEAGNATHVYGGMVQDAVSGMNDADFREYIPSAGRWLSPDPGGLAAVSLANPQSFNRYSYVGSSPTNLVDPLGLGPCDNNSDLPACNHEPHINDAAGNAAACVDTGLLPNCAGPWGSGELGAAEAQYLVNHNFCPGGCGGTTYTQGGLTYTWVPPVTAISSSNDENADFLITTGTGYWASSVRAPDFISLSINVGLPFLANLAGPTVAINMDRRGNVYVGGGINVGKAPTLLSVGFKVTG